MKMRKKGMYTFFGGYFPLAPRLPYTDCAPPGGNYLQRVQCVRKIQEPGAGLDGPDGDDK